MYCPSYKRAKTAISHKLFNPEKFVYVVREEEEKEYRKLGANLKLIPSGTVKDIATTRNYILDTRTTDQLVMVDDDLKSIIRTYNGKQTDMNQEQIDHMILNGFQMAEDCGSPIWGMNVQFDPRFYRIVCPFTFGLIILGPFIAIRDFSLRYDETLPLKEDYDFFLQHIQKSRRVLRFNMFSYMCDHQKLAGGCQEYRTSEAEKEQFRLLKEKWGEVVYNNHFAKESINPIIKTGL